MNENDDINNYLPSLLNPRCIRKQRDLSLTQNSTLSRYSLSLKRKNRASAKLVDKTNSNKENIQRIDILPPVQKSQINAPETEPAENLLCSLPTKEIILKQKPRNSIKDPKADEISVGFTFLEDLISDKNNTQTSLESIIDFNTPKENKLKNKIVNEVHKHNLDAVSIKSLISISSATELTENLLSESTDTYKLDCVKGQSERPSINVSFAVKDSHNVDVNAKNCTIKKFSLSCNHNDTNIDCEVIENSQISTETEVDENMNETSFSAQKRPAVAVNLEIKKHKLTHTDITSENSKVLILKTDTIEKISHVIVQPPNYKFVKRNLTHKSEYKKAKLARQNGIGKCVKLKQAAIDSFFRLGCKGRQLGSVSNDVSKEMSKNSGVIEAAKCDRLKRPRRELEISKSPRRELNVSPKSARLPSKKEVALPRRQDTSNYDAPSPRIRNESLSAHTPRKNVESLHFNLPIKSKSNRTSLSPRNIPHHKIVAGTHFAVDAFSYGDIPNVKHYFLTHFHSDHYSGLKKSFNKALFCSKITADLCISRLGVNPKNIRVINVDEVLRIDGIEVAAVDANHCPGALMLIFTLPNGKTLLHTGDFRACPAMESYPVFWNKDIHTVYLDTTYCNPRYDFPTQDQSLEMALYILRQKKLALENAGKKFSSVLIVCGTYTIGKEKFFLGMSRRVGCGVWACPEKERVLQIVEGRACSRDPPESCQLHVVPMRDLTHEKLRSYLDSLQGAFTEVVAFKPSGWENGKNSSVEKDLVTIHGIPYSEHSSFSELIRFIKFLKPKQVVPTVDISGGVKSVQKYFPCPLVYKDELQCQAKLTDYYSIHSRQQVPAVT